MGKILLLLCFLTLLPTVAHAEEESCRSAKTFATALKIDLQTPPPVLDHSKSRADINKDQTAQHEEWLKKNHMQSVWRSDQMETAGVSEGGWGALSGYKMRGQGLDVYALVVCTYFEEVDLDMMYRTIISIPKEFPKDSCAYNVILTHEMKHHNTNVKIVRDAVARFQKDLPTLVLEIENGSGGVSRGEVKQHIADIKAEFSDALDIYLKQNIMKEMKRQNALVDSPEEYTRSSKLLADCGVRRQN